MFEFYQGNQWAILPVLSLIVILISASFVACFIDKRTLPYIGIGWLAGLFISAVSISVLIVSNIVNISTRTPEDRRPAEEDQQRFESRTKERVRK